MTQMENQSVFALFAGIPFVRRALPIVRKLAAISILLGTITGAVAIVGRVDVADANVIKRPSFHPTFHPATRSLVRAPIRPRSFGTRNVGMHRATAPAYNRNMGHHDVGRHEEGRREGGRREGDRHEEGRHDKHTADRHDHQKTGSRNRSQFARIPLPDGPVDVDSFIDSIDDFRTPRDSLRLHKKSLPVWRDEHGKRRRVGWHLELSERGRGTRRRC